MTLRDIADNLKGQPFVFALVVINLLFLVAGVWIMRDVALNARERATDLHKLLEQCVGKIQDRKDAR